MVRKLTKKKCVICGDEFETYNKFKNKTCSRECLRKYFLRLASHKKSRLSKVDKVNVISDADKKNQDKVGKIYCSNWLKQEKSDYL